MRFREAMVTDGTRRVVDGQKTGVTLTTKSTFPRMLDGTMKVIASHLTGVWDTNCRES